MAIFSKFFVGIIIVGFLLPRSMGGPGPNPNERSQRIARIYNLMIEEFRRQRMQELAEAEAEAAAVAAAREFQRENSSNGGEESSDKDDSSSEGEDDRSSVLSTSDTEIDCEFHPTLKRSIIIYMTIPPTTCSIERTFSKLRRIKTWLHSTMCENRLSGFCIYSIIDENDENTLKSYRRIRL